MTDTTVDTVTLETRLFEVELATMARAAILAAQTGSPAAYVTATSLPDLDRRLGGSYAAYVARFERRHGTILSLLFAAMAAFMLSFLGACFLPRGMEPARDMAVLAVVMLMVLLVLFGLSYAMTDGMDRQVEARREAARTAYAVGPGSVVEYRIVQGGAATRTFEVDLYRGSVAVDVEGYGASRTADVTMLVDGVGTRMRTLRWDEGLVHALAPFVPTVREDGWRAYDPVNP